METILLESETAIKNIKLGEDDYQLTSKRLIINGNFIGLSELRGVSVDRITTQQYKMELSKANSIATKIILVIALVIGIYVASSSHEYGQWFILSVVFTLFLTAPITAIAIGITVAIISSYLKSTAKTITVTQITVTKKDDKVYLRQNYSADTFEQLNVLSNQINDLIY